MAGGPVHLPDVDELPHPVGHDPFWQESVFIWWRDLARPVGGIMRLGHEAHWEGRGRAPVWLGAHAGNKRYLLTVPDGPLDEADRKGPGLAAGEGISFDWDGGPRVRARRPGIELALDVEDLYPRTDFFPKDAGTLADDFCAGHFEASGRAVGRLTLEGERYDVEALCHRDHSWGPRRWDTMVSHRWVSGSAGPALSFGSISWHGSDGSLARFGYVVRDGEMTVAESVDMTVHMACDALTYSGGEVVWTLPGGETVTVAPKVEAAYVNEHEGHAFVDAICTFDYRGHQGFCDFEVTSNPRAGTGPITQCLLATNQQGISTV